MSAPEFSRPIDLRALTDAAVRIEADDSERRALARRFDLVAIKSLAAEAEFTPHGARISASGRLLADIVQSCAISGEDLPVRIEAELDLLFVPECDLAVEEEEYELAEEECDRIAYAGTAFDFGEAAAQSLALAVDPFVTGPEAEQARREHGLASEDAPSGPFAALAALKKDTGG